MDWFERLTGFRETSYDETRAKLKVDGRQLRSLVNGKSYGIGELELVSLCGLIANLNLPLSALRNLDDPSSVLPNSDSRNPPSFSSFSSEHDLI